MSDNYYGEKFLNRRYKDLYLSDEVQHTYKNGDTKEESIRRYLERLERIHRKANTKSKKDLLKNLYYDKYIIKKEEIPNVLDKNKIILEQKNSLDKWLIYLTSENASYPLWAKYWVFQGMLKMGTYDESKGIYQKRSKKTINPFVDANPEIIAKSIDYMIKSFNKESINDSELEEILKNGSFQKIYTIFERKYKNNIIDNSKTTEGIWIKYNEGNREEAIKLSQSLDCKNTGWCTASESQAIDQVCGTGFYPGGDFYVYYTKDNEDKYTIPRIAIRLEHNDKIGEIRGILEGQNLEESMEDILKTKLESINLQKEEIKESMVKLDDLRNLSKMIKKETNNEKLTVDEIINLYTKQYGFGWINDPKAEKLKESIIINDYFNKFSKEEKIKFIKETNYNDKIIIDDEDVAKIAVSHDYMYIYNLDLNKVTNYDEIAKLVVKNSGLSLVAINPEDVKDYDIIAKLAIMKDASSIYYIKPEDVKDYDGLAKLAVMKDGMALYYIKPENVKDYLEIARLAVKQNGWAIMIINGLDLPNYDELARLAVEQNGETIECIKPEKVKDYDELVKIASYASEDKEEKSKNDL